MKLGRFGNISFDLVVILLDLTLAMLFQNNSRMKEEKVRQLKAKREQKNMMNNAKKLQWNMKVVGKASNKRTKEGERKIYQVLFISCKPHDIRQCKVIFILLLFFGFLKTVSFFLLFYINRFELCGNVEEWLIFHYRIAILSICSFLFVHTKWNFFFAKSFSNWKCFYILFIFSRTTK